MAVRSEAPAAATAAAPATVSPVKAKLYDDLGDVLDRPTVVTQTPPPLPPVPTPVAVPVLKILYDDLGDVKGQDSAVVA